MSEWCQNKKCCYKKTQNQMRGSKDNKYYQSYKSNEYYLGGNACSLGCEREWIRTNINTCMNTVGTIGKQTIGADDDWRFKSDYRVVESVSDSRHIYHLVNYLQGIRREITREQAQTTEQLRQDYGWCTRPDSEAKPLAIQLGLAS